MRANEINLSIDVLEDMCGLTECGNMQCSECPFDTEDADDILDRIANLVTELGAIREKAL